MAVELPVPTIQEVARMAPELNNWTTMAARAYGIYAGVNQALKKTRGKNAIAKDRAQEVRQEMIMMTLIRLFAVMDRQSEVSMQSVYRFLKQPNALDEVSLCYSSGLKPGSDALKTCSTARDKFLSTYLGVDFKSFGRIQSFRNGQIAHLEWPEAEMAKVTYSEVEAMVRACCEMAGQLTLMTSGHNDWPLEHLNEAHEDAYEFWHAAIVVDSEGELFGRTNG